MKKRTKALQFDSKTKLRIVNRDHECVFCKMGYATPGAEPLDVYIKDIMHFINKSQGGLGIMENGALGCRYHHHLFDDGNEGMRDQMKQDLEAYLKDLYPEWDKEKLYYKKYPF